MCSNGECESYCGINDWFNQPATDKDTTQLWKVCPNLNSHCNNVITWMTLFKVFAFGTRWTRLFSNLNPNSFQYIAPLQSGGQKIWTGWDKWQRSVSVFYFSMLSSTSSSPPDSNPSLLNIWSLASMIFQSRWLCGRSGSRQRRADTPPSLACDVINKGPTALRPI